MFGKSCRTKSRHRMHVMASSGNSAFDAYRDETIQRLEEEQASFEAFLERLREAKDKSEFDQSGIACIFLIRDLAGSLLEIVESVSVI